VSAAGFELDPAARAVLRLALAWLFARAAAHKLRDPRGFRAALADYRLLPEALLAPAAAAVAGAELALAVLLLAPGAGPLPALAAAALLVLYTAAIAVNLARGRRHIACGCAGPAAEAPLHEALLARNAGLVGLALAAALPAAPRPLEALDAASVAGGAAALALLLAAAEVAIANAARQRVLREPASARLRLAARRLRRLALRKPA
jgi:uncharacterized membrane protein YphA (DoxX/SURF4 family)